jgi:hypothetical protein
MSKLGNMKGRRVQIRSKSKHHAESIGGNESTELFLLAYDAESGHQHKNDVRDALINVQRMLGREKTQQVDYLQRGELFDNYYGLKRSPSPDRQEKTLARTRHTASLERFEELEIKRQQKLEAKRLQKLMQEEASMSEVPIINSNIKAKSQYRNTTKTHSKANAFSRAKQLEVENLKECTFKPDLSITKRKGRSKSREASEDPTISDFYEDKGRTPSQFIEWGQEKESKLAQLRLLHANDENVITQSVPKINERSKKLVAGLA